MRDKCEQLLISQQKIKDKEAKNELFTANSFVVGFFFFSNCSLHACLCLAVCVCVSCACVLFLSMPALLMGCHPGLSRKAASSVGLGINPGIMALMPS